MKMIYIIILYFKTFECVVVQLIINPAKCLGIS